MKTFSNPFNLTITLLFAIIGLLIMLLITFFVANAKKKTSLNVIYVLVGGIFIGIVGLRAAAINNIFYFYMIIMFWNLFAGILHVYFSGKFLEWPKTEPVGWSVLFALAVVMIGYSMMFTLMKIFPWQLPQIFVWYYLSAVLTFFIPLTMVFAIECYQSIPARIYLQQAWIYKKGPELEWDPNVVSHFVLVRYKLTTQTGGQTIESLPMIAPQDHRLGDYFNSTIEYFKVTQDQYNIEVRDRSNNSLGWYFILADGSSSRRFRTRIKPFLSSD